MKLANSIRISVFAKEDEDESRIEEGLKSVIPLDFEREKISVERKTSIGFNERKIRILGILLQKDRHINAFLEFLGGKLGERQKGLLLRQKESRLDSELYFFIRLDKEKLLNGEFFITDSGSCYHIRISIAAFPKSRLDALGVVERIFG